MEVVVLTRSSGDRGGAGVAAFSPQFVSSSAFHRLIGAPLICPTARVSIGAIEGWARAVRGGVAARAADGLGSSVRRLGWSALYGAAIGCWRGQEQTLYAALKLPLVLALTWLATVPFSALLLWSVGRRLAARDIVAGTLAPLANAAVLLASLAPIAALFGLALPVPGASARTEHNLLFLLHTLLIAAAGVVGTARFRAFVSEGLDARRTRGVVALWILVYAVVGGEVAWALRPFVGSVYEPIELVRSEALDGNLYEFIATDIVPFLTRRLTE